MKSMVAAPIILEPLEELNLIEGLLFSKRNSYLVIIEERTIFIVFSKLKKIIFKKEKNKKK
jgi:hypothetical protein